MLAFQHACRESDREVGDVCASFIEEANAIVEQDQKAIEDRLAAVEAEKVSGCFLRGFLACFTHSRIGLKRLRTVSVLLLKT